MKILREMIGYTLVLVVACGCAGSGPVNESLAGRYQGVWSRPANPNFRVADEGTFDLIVDPQGNVSGTTTSKRYGPSSGTGGTITSALVTDIISGFPTPDPNSPAEVGLFFRGQLTRSGRTLSGTLYDERGGDAPENQIPVTVRLTRR